MNTSSSRRYAIVIPVFNQLEYTRQCIESLLRQSVDPSDVLIVDNASSDGTQEWLTTHPELRQLRNETNLGCGCAWTQGAVLSHNAEWIVLLNNDVLAGPDAIDALLDAAERERFGVVSPALLEGENDYGFEAFAQEYIGDMSGLVRRDRIHGVCFAIHRRVIEQVGFPDTDRRLGGYEDAEFMIRCLRAEVPIGIVGDSVFHHFGSITQKAIALETGLKSLGDRAYFHARIGLDWKTRKKNQVLLRGAEKRWVAHERSKSKYSMHMRRQEGAWEFN